MSSLCGRNVLFCAIRYYFSVMDICSSEFKSKIVNDLCNAARSVDDAAVVSMLAEATFVRDGIFTVTFNNSDCMLTKCDINEIISNICSA